MVTAGIAAVVFVIWLAVRVAGLNSRPRWVALRGGPYDGELALIEPDTIVWVTEGIYAEHTYRRCSEDHFHYVGSSDVA